MDVKPKEAIITMANAIIILSNWRGGPKLKLTTVLGWVKNGLTDRTTRQHVRLRAWKLGGRWSTSQEAVFEFITALTPNLTNPTNLPRTATQRQKASEKAAQHLKEMGV